MPIYLRALCPPRSQAQGLAIAFGASLLTHPFVWFVFPRLIPHSYWGMAIAAELFAWLVEAAWLRAFGVKRALLWALVANATSVALGLLSRALFGLP